ncbi:alpha/beta fold hydrolase [soil metagenome]
MTWTPDTELRRRFDRDGEGAIAWERWGDGEGRPLVLCHGYTGSAHDFALNIDVLSARRPVLALDLRGHGRSHHAADESRYSLEQLADDLVAFLEANGGGAVDLLGHSMGGWVSLAATIERPDLVRSLILMDTSAWQFGDTDEELRVLYAAFLHGFDPAGGLPDVSGLESPEQPLVDAATPPQWRTRKDELAIDPYALKALGRQLLGHGLPSLRSRLADVRCPVTVIVGEHDHPYVDQADDLAREVADGTATVIEGAHHSPQLTHRDAWHAAVEAHLTRAAQPG